ncbi:hypothetical protein KSI01_24340 [Kurthia sibirica]|uniref:Uncharacterized protein n=1 Tax=Kurthia sibirica TaxID=202750 RepID=A0A2U3AH74_9BACL|nr:hypothetical protein DEX24_15395 [Kurthia sibirica]GEK34901.1 hypothetical protein KSI01_24340 [Kurthia sibirica]
MKFQFHSPQHLTQSKKERKINKRIYAELETLNFKGSRIVSYFIKERCEGREDIEHKTTDKTMFLHPPAEA